MVSDIVLLEELPKDIMDSVSAYVECVSGALQKETYLDVIRKAGFTDVNIVEENTFSLDCFVNNPVDETFAEKFAVTPEQIEKYSSIILSIRVSAIKAS